MVTKKSGILNNFFLCTFIILGIIVFFYSPVFCQEKEVDNAKVSVQPKIKKTDTKSTTVKSTVVEEDDIECVYYTKSETKEFNLEHKGAHAVECEIISCPGGYIFTLLSKKGEVKCSTTGEYDNDCNLILFDDGCNLQ